jgi:uracil phosphoribosyltransferase
VNSHFPENTTVWLGAVDDELTAKSYIVPGLGDAGDLAYGKKSE